MKVAVWLDIATWPAAIEAAQSRPDDDTLILLAVADPATLGVGAASLMGRGRRRDPHQLALATAHAEELLADAAATLGRDCEQLLLTGPTERVVTEAAQDVGMLIVVRDGDLRRLGPASLGKKTRFIIDHAPCRVLLIWPEIPPTLDTLPLAPPR